MPDDQPDLLAWRRRESGYLKPGELGYSNATTSREAAEKVATSASQWRERVYQRIAAKALDGSTDDELSAFFGVPANTVAPRRTELAAAGRVVDSGRRRKTRSGGSAIVWVAAEAKPQVAETDGM